MIHTSYETQVEIYKISQTRVIMQELVHEVQL